MAKMASATVSKTVGLNGRAGSTPAGSTRVCGKCRAPRPLEDFALRNAARGTRSSTCKPCHRAYSLAHYSDNRRKYIDRAKKRRAPVRIRNRVWVRKHKALRACVDCGGKFHHAAMDFDHTAKNKRAAVARLVGSCLSLNTLRAEIRKCDLVCSNCHRVRTFKRLHGERP